MRGETDSKARRRANRDFKEREVWVAAPRNIDAQESSLWFGLKNEGHPNAAMRAAWTVRGSEAPNYGLPKRIV